VSASVTDHTIDFRDVVTPVARRWKLVAAVTALVALGTAGYGLVQPTMFTASSTLTVFPITLDPLSSSSASQTVNITTEREVLGSTEVARIAAAALGHVDATTLDRSSSVEAPSGSQVLEVSATAGSPERAAEWANALAAAYLEFRGQGAELLAKARLDDVNARIAAAEASGNTAGIGDLRSQALALSEIGANPGRIIGVAEAPDKPSSLSLSVYLIAGILGGLLLGALAAIVRDRADRRVRFPATLSRVTGTDALEVRRGDSEALRWLHREVRTGFSADRKSPIVVSVFGVRPADVASLVDGLAELGGELDRPVRVLGPTELPPELLDKPWRYQGADAEKAALVLVDSRHILSRAHQASLAQGSDLAVVVASAHSRKAETVRLMDAVRLAGKRIYTVFTDSAHEPTPGRNAVGRLLAGKVRPVRLRVVREYSPALVQADRSS
jgi:hypothetical protein